jgi:CDP-diacylglycerol--serine O-phosphatidyltransferase
VNGAVIVATAFLEVSRIPTFSFKKVKVPQKAVLPTLLAVGALAAFLVSAPWATCIAVAVAYIASIPFAARSFRRLQKAAEEIQSQGLHGAKPEPRGADAAE